MNKLFVVQHPDGKWTIQDKATGAGMPITQQYAGSSVEIAQFIVRACNAHEGLVRALEVAQKALFAASPIRRADWADYEEAEKIVKVELATAKGNE